MQSGLVIKEQSGFYWVETAEGNVYRCVLRGKLKEEAQSSDIAAIGDRVEFTIIVGDEEGEKGTIESVEERTSALSRAVRTEGNRGAGESKREHVIIANADRAFFVFAAAQPSPDLAMLDSFIVAGEKAEIDELIIVVNKVDLEDPSNIKAMFGHYEKMGYQVIHTSALHNLGIEELRTQLKDHISVFTGPSGVGKTSLLNRIQPDLGRSVKAVSGYHQEGVHTTRDSALIKVGETGYLADTPGMRSISPYDVEPEELDAYFIDIAEHAVNCRFGNCTHISEPPSKCAVKTAVKQEQISPIRYKNYRKLREELESMYAVY